MLQGIRWSCLVHASALFLAGCVVPNYPQAVSIFEVPKVSGSACSATLVRKKQLAGSAPSHFISLDNRIVAALEAGEYTTFDLSEGRHTLGLKWRIMDRMDQGMGVIVLTWSPYEKSVEVDCQPPAAYLFTITSKGFVLDDHDRVELERVERLDGDFRLDRNGRVSPGPR